MKNMFRDFYKFLGRSLRNIFGSFMKKFKSFKKDPLKYVLKRIKISKTF